MTAQSQTFLQANPVTTTLSRAARWAKLNVDIQDVTGNYCSTFHAQRTGKLSVLRVRGSQARPAYVADPGSHHALDALRRTAADTCSIPGSRMPQMPCGLGSCCMSMGISPPTVSTIWQRQQATVNSHLRQQQGQC